MSSLLKPFQLERFFAKWEFSAPHLACCSDPEPLLLQELLALANPEDKKQWDDLRLSYTETQGLPALRQAIAETYFTTKKADEHMVICAPEEGIYLTMLALLKPGDNVVVSYPGYQSLYEIASSLGCSVSRWEPEIRAGSSAEVKFRVQDLKASIKANTRMVVTNFPHNPTGALLSHEEWQELVNCCTEHGCWLFSDEMYRTLELDPTSRLPCAADCLPHGISLGGCSKSLALPGLRLGWIVCQQESLIKRILELKDYTTICAAGPSEILALIAVRASDHIISRNLDLIRGNIAAFQALVNEFPHLLAWQPPAAGSVALPRLLAEVDIEAWCEQVVTQTGVLLLPASVYDHQPSRELRHFRVGLGRSNFIKDCIPRLREFLLSMT